MDPLTALSLASNVIQIVQFGGCILGSAGELYRSPAGSLTVNDELEFVTTNLRTLVTKLRDSIPASDGKDGTDPGHEDPSDSLKSICGKASSVADELVEKLENLKLEDGGEQGQSQVKFRKFKSLKVAIKTRWSQKDISALSERLSRLNDALQTQEILAIRQSTDAGLIRTSARFDSLDSANQDIISLMLETQANTTSEVIKAIREEIGAHIITINPIPKSQKIESHECHSPDHTGNRICMHDNLPEVPPNPTTACVEMFDVSDAAEKQLRASVCNKIIQSLTYEAMSYRYEDIIEAHPETFEWVFHDPRVDGHSWSNFPEWLKSGSSVYWMNGKAGSGKSTLMKFIFDQERTREYLQMWAGDTPLAIATFFFWNSGEKEQKSQSGFLRAILYQVLSQYPDLVPECFPKDWAKLYSMTTHASLVDHKMSWPLGMLMSGLQALIHQKNIPLKIFILVDGLDEFDGEQEGIANLFQEITKSVSTKACVSSRPLVDFEEAFVNCPQLKLQNLTHRDIERYACDKLDRNNAFQRLSKSEPYATRTLVYDIVHKADGVFLWVKLVVKSLLAGIKNRDNLSHLQDRVDSCPSDLEPLYNHLLGQIEPRYLPWASKVFQCLQLTQELRSYPLLNAVRELFKFPLSVVLLFLAVNDEVDIAALQDPNNLEEECEDTIIHLMARCAGFVEVSKPKKHPQSFHLDLRVHFFHRTARDFLETKSAQIRLSMKGTSDDFNPCYAMMRSCIRALELTPLTIEAGGEFDSAFVYRNEIDHGHVSYLATETMMYAHYAEYLVESQSSRIKLLDHFSNAMDQALKDWLRRYVDSKVMCTSSETIPEGESNIYTLILAARFGINSYVGYKLSLLPENSGRRADTASRLLWSLLPSEPADDFDRLVPAPSTELVSLLLANGANPNWRYNSPYASLFISTWERTILFMLSLRRKVLFPFAFPTKYSKIMLLLVKAGAHRYFSSQLHLWFDQYEGLQDANFDTITLMEQIMRGQSVIDVSPVLSELRLRYPTGEREEERTRGRVQDIK